MDFWIDTNEKDSIKREEEIQILPYMWEIGSTYIMKIMHYLQIDKRIHELEIWQELKIISYDKLNSILLLELVSIRAVTGTISERNAFKKYDKFLYEALKYLELKLDNQGRIVGLINKEDIFKRWKEIRFRQFNVSKWIDIGYDQVEFVETCLNNLEYVVKNKLLLNFFIGINKGIKYKQNKELLLHEGHKRWGVLFAEYTENPPLFVYKPFYTTDFLKDTDNKIIEISITSKQNLNILEQPVLAALKEMFNNSVEHTFLTEAKYFYTVEGVLLEAVCYLKEQITPDIALVGRIEISKKNEKLCQ